MKLVFACLLSFIPAALSFCFSNLCRFSGRHLALSGKTSGRSYEVDSRLGMCHVDNSLWSHFYGFSKN